MLHTFAIASIGIALPCSLVIVADVVRRPQKMGVMNVVWPVTALYFSVFALWERNRAACNWTKVETVNPRHLR